MAFSIHGLRRSESNTIVQPQMLALRFSVNQIFQGFLRCHLAGRKPAIDAVGTQIAIVGLAGLFGELAADGGGERQGKGAVRVRMYLGEETKLEAGLDSVLLALFPGPKSP